MSIIGCEYGYSVSKLIIQQFEKKVWCISFTLFLLYLWAVGNRDPAGVRGLWKPRQVLLQEGGPGENHEKQAGAGGAPAAWLQQGPPRWESREVQQQCWNHTATASHCKFNILLHLWIQRPVWFVCYISKQFLHNVLGKRDDKHTDGWRIQDTKSQYPPSHSLFIVQGPKVWG